MGMGMGMGMGMMNGQQGGFMQRFNMAIFSLCDTAQMLDYNASGLASFGHILRTVGVKLVNVLYSIGLWCIAKSADCKVWLRRKFHEYFRNKDLN